MPFKQGRQEGPNEGNPDNFSERLSSKQRDQARNELLACVDSITMVSCMAGSFISTAVFASGYMAPSMTSVQCTNSATDAGLKPKRCSAMVAMKLVHDLKSGS